MRSVPVEVFFSASFDPADKQLNDFFLSICAALDIRVENVSFGACRVPPDQALKMISRSQGLIAVCTKREELKSGSFNMPQAVNDEIAFACGMDLPILAFIEEGVNKGGFGEKFKTYQKFSRSTLSDSAFLQDAIRSIHEFKVDLIGDHQIGSTHEPDDSHAEEMTHLVELKRLENDFVWEYSTTKKVKYIKNSSRSFPTSVFSAVPGIVPEGAPPIHWEYEHISSSGALRLIPEIDTQNATCVTARLRPDPAAEDGDQIVYRTFSRHRHLTALWDDEVDDEHLVHLDAGDFNVAEGLLFIHRTKKAIIEFRFCREYGLKKREVVPFVASYTSSIDFEVPSELTRADVRVEDMGGSLTVRMEVSSALPGHLYGIAWNPRQRPVSRASLNPKSMEKMLLEPKHDLVGDSATSTKASQS